MFKCFGEVSEHAEASFSISVPIIHIAKRNEKQKKKKNIMFLIKFNLEILK